MPLRSADTRIPRKPFLWLTAALVFTVPPMFGQLALWVPLFFLTILAGKFLMEPRDYRLRSPVLKMVLGAAVLGAVFATYGTVEGIEPGVSIVVMFMSLKILEAHTAREFQVMVNVGWMLCLCGFFLSQDLAIAFCALIAFTLCVVALIEFHRGSSAGANWPPVSAALKLILQATPLILVLFILFPRLNLGVRLQLPGGKGSAAGFSGEVSPGSVTSLANSADVAFRAQFLDGDIPSPDKLYWRGAVLSQGDGFEWRGKFPPAGLPRSSRRTPVGRPVRQSITIEPHNNNWMFALDWPAEAPPGSGIAPGYYLWSAQPIRSARNYDVISFPELADKELHPREKGMYLSVPDSISPRIRHLVESWRTGAATPNDVINRGLNFFRTQHFRYSLSPGEYQGNDLDEFLFKRRTGFCEHYAASFATLMRLAGIPSRVIVGYLGGDYNEIGHFFVVHQSDSHAWCEVWIPDTGWKRIDPTSIVAPDRVMLGLSGFLEKRSATANAPMPRGLVRSLARSPFFNRMRLAWQAANYAWDTRVLGYDETAQIGLLNSLGFFGRSPLSIATAGLAAACVTFAAWFGWIRFRTRSIRDQLKIAYETFCSKLARLGAARQSIEGPHDFSIRAARLLPDRSDQIRRISDMYIALRYNDRADPNLQSEFAGAVKQFR